jgi:hypothetical protein
MGRRSEVRVRWHVGTFAPHRERARMYADLEASQDAFEAGRMLCVMLAGRRRVWKAWKAPQSVEGVSAGGL